MNLLIQKNRAKTFFHEKLSRNSDIINLLIKKKDQKLFSMKNVLVILR